MRQVATLLLFGVALTAGAAEIWRWKDANGVVHYSDNPVPGAELISVFSAPPSGGDLPPPIPAPQMPPLQPPPQAAPFTYSTCAVLAPVSDETFRGVQPVDVKLSIEPGLRTGHRIQLLFNGVARLDWPPGSISFTLPEVLRGSHTLAVRIVDQNGQVVCSGPSSTFHLQQVSVLSPGRTSAQPGPPPAGN
ncbi:MAG TPA: DUF4124 domain-containing protein [Steroidobacteraceae bacterium]|nr:DUF4124 domain-containing protein [Steroidobacteraceae bacterium]